MATTSVLTEEPRKFTFFPEKPREWVRRPKVFVDAWKAPEHGKMTKDMARAIPRDDLGRKIKGAEPLLVIDNRPSILVPPRTTVMGWL